MYESLTRFLPQIKSGSNGEWIYDKVNDGSQEHPMHLGYVEYNDGVNRLFEQLYVFMEMYPEYELVKYQDTLKKHGINYLDDMKTVDVSKLDGHTIMAALMGVSRLDRFSEGTIWQFCEDGSIAKWLERLKEIDLNNNSVFIKTET